jgi:hypothetical protein
MRVTTLMQNSPIFTNKTYKEIQSAPLWMYGRLQLVLLTGGDTKIRADTRLVCKLILR